MKNNFILIAILVATLPCFSQIKRHDAKKIFRSNYFFAFKDKPDDDTTSRLVLLKPKFAFWATIKEEGSAIIITPVKRLAKGKKDFFDTIPAPNTSKGVPISDPKLNATAFRGKAYFPEIFFEDKKDTFSTGNFPVKERQLKRIFYRDFKFVLQAITVPIKFRKSIDTIPYTSETGVNIGIGAGVKWSYNWYRESRSFLGQKTNSLSFTPGVLLGIGAADIKAKVSAPASFKDRKEPIFTFGGFFMIGFNNINLGFIVGQDVALKDGGKAGGWFYNAKPWTGIAVALDLIK